MIDIVQHRSRIGLFRQKLKNRKFLYRNYSSDTGIKQGKETFKCFQALFKICLLIAFLSAGDGQIPLPVTDQSWQNQSQLVSGVQITASQALLSLRPPSATGKIQLEYHRRGKKESCNFLAKYKNGNRNMKGIKNLHLNIRSLGRKISEVKNIIKEHSPHIFGLSECELKKVQGYYDERKLKIPGYDLLFPQSWAKHGKARVVVYVKKTLEYQQLHDLEDETIQSVWIKGGFRKSKKIFFCHGYREHTSTLGNSIRAQSDYLGGFLSQWEEATLHGNPSEPNETHICCDMNLDTLGGRWLQPAYHLFSLSKLVQSACDLSNFSQLVNQPTRSQYNSVKKTTDISCIDHIYTNRKFRCSNVVVSPFGDSDHDLISYVRVSKDPPAPARTIRKRSYKNFKQDQFLADLGNVDWSDVFRCEDVDMANEIFTRKFQFVLNGHAPWIIFQVRKCFKPWLTEETKRLMDKRDQMKDEAVELAKAGNDRASVAWAEFKKVRNEVTNRKKYEEINFKKEKVSASLDSSANTWECAKTFMEWDKSGGPPQQLNNNGRLVTSAGEIATIMNEFFIEKVRLIRDGIRNVPNNFHKCIEIMRGKNCRLNLNHVTVKKVNKLLKGLKDSKSTSIDEIDNFCVKVAADIIDKPLHHIITLSVLQQKFPTNWKYSKVIPLHKKECKLNKKNYRPVSILSPFSKILEKIAYEQLYDHFTNKKIFHPNLHGYRQNRSTQTALLQMYDRWARAAGSSKVSGVVLLDLSAAFDLVDPAILIQKLRIYGVEEDFLCWISSYLTNRYQAVWMDHILSEFLHSEIGVPQGSNLGPLLFLIYFNDLPYTLEGEIDSYADDTTMTMAGDSVEEIGRKLTEDCRRVSEWMTQNKLKLNPDKTHILTVGTEQKLRTLANPVEVTMDGYLLEEDPAKSEFLLGCHIESGLKWTKHVGYLVSKLRKRLVALAHIRNIAPYPVRKMIAIGIFNSVLTYCLPLFGDCGVNNLKEIQILQNKAAQIVSHSPPRAARVQMFTKLDWLTVNQLVAYHTLISVFKIRNSREPEYLSKFLSNDSRYGKIMFEKIQLKVATRSFVFRGSESWNLLPIAVKNCQKIGEFKPKLRKWVKANVPMFRD